MKWTAVFLPLAPKVGATTVGRDVAHVADVAAAAAPHPLPRCVDFSNGTRKVTHPDGRASIHFSNGDIKRQHPGGRVDYFYAEVGATYPLPALTSWAPLPRMC